MRRNNDELLATYGNLVHRVLTLTHRHFDGRVPSPGAIDEAGQVLLHRAESTLGQMDSLLCQCHFREAIRAAMSLAQETNRYLEQKSPWRLVKTDKEGCGTVLFVSISVISYFYPFLPFSSQKLHQLLGSSGLVKDERWVFHAVPPGQKLAQPEPLFAKLDDAIAVEETERLRSARK
ncbi:MAG: class I tRNA ligase family protein [Chloroflexi bacterium]|nr:class I tRNA ligase family protein [Chloroflexota bacterium]